MRASYQAIAASALLKGLRSGAHDIKTAAIIDFYDMTFPFHYYDFYVRIARAGVPLARALPHCPSCLFLTHTPSPNPPPPFHQMQGDGGHYGRPIYYIPPGRTTPYTHFVDDFCVQVLLGAMCS